MYNLNLLKKLLIDEYPILRKYIKVNYGLLPEQEDARDYIMGASNDKINWKVIKQDSNWLPEAKQMINEVQRSGKLETMNCTRFALNNVIELLHLGKWGEVVNYSDRFPGDLQGTTRSGNSMRNQLECTRKYGLVLEKDYPWEKEKFNWAEYYARPPKAIMDKGELWTKKYTFGYDAVWATKSMVIEALKYSPLYVALYAWYSKGNLYYSAGNPNHASVIISREQFLNYDSYEPHIKELSEDFKLYYVKRIYLEKKGLEFDKDKLDYYKNKRGAEFLMRVENHGEIYDIRDGKLIHKSGNDFLTEKAKEAFNNKTMLPISERDFLDLLTK